METVKNPKEQTTDMIVASLLTNKRRQYTESAHAEIFRRLIETIKRFNAQADKVQRDAVLGCFSSDPRSSSSSTRRGTIQVNVYDNLFKI